MVKEQPHMPHPSVSAAYVRAEPVPEYPALPLAQQWGAVLWASFLTAGLCTTVFFALVDPIDLWQISIPAFAPNRELGYTIGFFMFWAASALSSASTWFLLRPRSHVNQRSR